MWFKQSQVFLLSSKIDIASLSEQLAQFAFEPCLPSFPSSLGWVCPLTQNHDEDSVFIHAAGRYAMCCLQFEEKILPPAVVQQALEEKIKKIETTEGRKVPQKEKRELKDNITHSLIPKAFSKKVQVNAFIDTQRDWLIVDCLNAKKIESFLSLFKRATGVNLHYPSLKNLSALMTNWLLYGDGHPEALTIEKACMLQDTQQKGRMIRCRQQDLFSSEILSLAKDGCEVKEMALSLPEQVDFVLTEEMQLRNLRFHDQIIANAKELYTETWQQQFDADFVMMTEILSSLFAHLLPVLTESDAEAIVEEEAEDVAELA